MLKRSLDRRDRSRDEDAAVTSTANGIERNPACGGEGGEETAARNGARVGLSRRAALRLARSQRVAAVVSVGRLCTVSSNPFHWPARPTLTYLPTEEEPSCSIAIRETRKYSVRPFVVPIARQRERGRLYTYTHARNEKASEREGEREKEDSVRARIYREVTPELSRSFR